MGPPYGGPVLGFRFQSLAQQPQSLAQQQQCWQPEQRQQLGLCWLWKYQLRRGFAAAHPILLPQPAKSSLVPLLPLLPLLLLPTLLLLTSQMATLGLPGQTLRLLGQT